MNRPSHFLNGSKNTLFLIIVIVLIVSTLVNPGTSVSATPPAAEETPAAPLSNGIVFLPILRKLDTSANPPGLPKVFGIYPTQYWHSGSVQYSLDMEFHSLDQWAGKRLSLAGVFHSFDQPNTVTNMLPLIWDNGYTPFVNLYANTTAENIANGGWDSSIRAWARNFKTYSNNGRRFAFLAPLQEMNGNWVPYGLHPSSFKAAYKRIRDIFANEGVPDASVAWVFAPNGYSRRQDPPFEDYYPGDALVDVVGFSGYNFGYHPKNLYKDWETPEEVYGPYITRMKAMAPDKPIFIAQTGTTAYTASGISNSAKNQWLRDAYPYLVKRDVWAIIYYNANQTYDWALYAQNSFGFDGYRDGIADPAYGYVSPGEIRDAFR